MKLIVSRDPQLRNADLACRYCLHMVLSMQTCLHFNSFETSLRPNKMCFATHRLGTNENI